MKLKFVLFFSLVFVAYHSINAQENSIGIQLGGGVISSLSPEVGSFSSAIFYERFFNINTGMRVKLVYAGDYDMLIPGSKKRYTPFLRGVSLSGINNIFFKNDYYFDQGVGLTALNDRIFSGRSEWAYGVVFSLGLGRRVNNFTYAAAADYALTFSSSQPKYFSLTLQGRYFF